MVEVLKVFPDKAADSWVIGYAFFGTVGKAVSPCQAMD